MMRFSMCLNTSYAIVSADCTGSFSYPRNGRSRSNAALPIRSVSTSSQKALTHGRALKSPPRKSTGFAPDDSSADTIWLRAQCIHSRTSHKPPEKLFHPRRHEFVEISLYDPTAESDISIPSNNCMRFTKKFLPPDRIPVPEFPFEALQFCAMQPADTVFIQQRCPLPYGDNWFGLQALTVKSQLLTGE